MWCHVVVCDPWGRPWRIDFVAVPESWLPCVTSAGAELTIDLCAPRLDHIAVVLRLRFSVLTGEACAPCSCRQKICDPMLLNDLVRVEAFQRELLSFPELPQELDPDSHHFLMTNRLQQSVATHFPVQKEALACAFHFRLGRAETVLAQCCLCTRSIFAYCGLGHPLLGLEAHDLCQ